MRGTDLRHPGGGPDRGVCANAHHFRNTCRRFAAWAAMVCGGSRGVLGSEAPGPDTPSVADG